MAVQLATWVVAAAVWSVAAVRTELSAGPPEPGRRAASGSRAAAAPPIARPARARCASRVRAAVAERDAAVGAAVGAADDASDDEPPQDEVVPVEEDDLRDGEVPDAARGAGSCVLHLALTDPDAGGAVAAAVRLWRLGVPAGHGWTAGDHVQARFDVPVHGATVRDLPPGRYRAQIDAQRAGAPDPAEFTVGDETGRTLVISTPREFPARCIVVDETGDALPEAGLRWRSGGGSTRGLATPRWARPRSPEGRERRRSLSCGAGCGGGAAEVVPVLALDGGFDLGTVRESTRTSNSRRSWTLTFEGRTSVAAHVRSDDAGKGPLVSVSVPLERVVAHVLLPDGRGVLEAGACVEAECDAVVRTSDAPADLWRTLPIEVQVSLDGYEKLAFDWRVADPAPAAVVLTPRER